MASLVGNAQKAPKKQSATPEKEYFISTSFHEPATDGLRFIYSEDAIHWKAMPDIFLEPRVGKQKVLRDPSGPVVGVATGASAMPKARISCTGLT